MKNLILQPASSFNSFNVSGIFIFIFLVLVTRSHSSVAQSEFNNFDWGTYFDSDYDNLTGFMDEELVDGIAIDRHTTPESIYIVGRTKSLGNYNDTICDTNYFAYGAADAFIAKYGADSTGACGALQWVRYFGNPKLSDYAYCIALDYNPSEGRTYLYVGGDTKGDSGKYGAFACSFDGCPNPPFQTVRSDTWEGWIAKYADDGTLLRWTFLGGHRNSEDPTIDQVLSLAVDSVSHDVLATGYTESLNIGTGAVNTYDKKYNSKGDAYIAVLDPCLSTLKFFSYYDISTADTITPTGQDRGHSIVVDNQRNIYISGTTESAGGIATPGTFQSVYKGGTDAFVGKWAYGVGTNGVVKYTPIWGSYIGGKSTDRGRGLALDDAGNCFVTGWTASKSFPATSKAFQQVPAGKNDAFITKFDPNGHGIWCTLFGGIGDELDNGIAWYKDPNDPNNKIIYIIGLTNSTNMPLQDPLVANLNGNPNNTNLKYDAFIAGIQDGWNPGDTQKLKFATYIGGSRDETNQQALSYGPNLAFGPNYELYFTFSTKSDNIGTVSHADKIIVGYHNSTPITLDAFLGKLIDTANVAMSNCNTFPTRLSETTPESEIIQGSMKYYPNPVSDQLTVKLETDAAGMAQIELMDMLGRKMNSQSYYVYSGMNELKVNFSGLTPGVYLLHIQVGNESHSVSVIKQ